MILSVVFRLIYSDISLTIITLIINSDNYLHSTEVHLHRTDNGPCGMNDMPVVFLLLEHFNAVVVDVDEMVVKEISE